jgi:methionyl-tRNA formyltransferase
MRIVFAGTPAVAVPSLRALAASQHDLTGVVTRPDRPSGRGRTLAQSAVSEAAAEFGLPVLKPAHPGDLDFQAELAAWRPDAVAVVAYGALLPQSALDIPTLGWINLHFSLLPAWRGAAPVQRAIWHGDEITGATTFRIVRELDAGPVYGVMTYAVPARATSGDVLTALAGDGARLLVSTMDAVASGDARPAPQTAEGATYAEKVSVRDALVDWEAPALAVDRQIRACTPDPGAWTCFRGRRLRLGPVTPVGVADIGPATPPWVERVLRGRRTLRPGELLATKRQVLAGAASGPVALGEVAPSGKAPMEAAAWARGVRIEDGERLGHEPEGR